MKWAEKLADFNPDKYDLYFGSANEARMYSNGRCIWEHWNLSIDP